MSSPYFSPEHKWPISFLVISPCNVRKKFEISIGLKLHLDTHKLTDNTAALCCRWWPLYPAWLTIRHDQLAMCNVCLFVVCACVSKIDK